MKFNLWLVQGYFDITIKVFFFFFAIVLVGISSRSMLQEKITNWMNWAGGTPINGWQWQIDGCGLANAIRLCF